jgi:uncharacterized membrane protein
MSDHAEKNSKDRLSAKKSAVLKHRSGSRIGVVAAISVFLLASVVYFAFFYSFKESSGSESISSAPEAQGRISFPVGLFDDGAARHFKHVDGIFTIKFFVIKSADGVIRAAFDACDVCWRSGKGYFQEGDHMVCRNCGQKFASDRVNEVKGGCNPAPLERKIVGANVVIETRDILEGKKYFNFPGRG